MPRPAAAPSLEPRTPENRTWSSDADLPVVAAGRGTREVWRRRLLIGLAILVLAAGGAYGARWFLVGRYLETTDDAYLQADNAVVAPKVAGYIAAVAVTDNEMVSAGQSLARIDDRDYRAELAGSEADVAQAEADIAGIAAQIEQHNARLAQTQAALASSGAAAEFAGQEAARFDDLVRTGAVSLKQAQQGRSDLKRAHAAVAEASAMLDAEKGQIGVLESARAKAVAALKRAEAAREQARLRLSYTELVAPMAGAIGDRSIRVGQYVQPGTRLMTIVPVHDIYLVANFKETQLRGIYRGERVKIAVDTFPGLDVTGTVDSVAPGTGAQFALLPAENATGNFTRIVQRVPVKILIDRDSLGGAELRPGLSATATVDTRTAPESRTTLATAPR
jgi:membrane fusion protein (multidrug efflux system)